MGDISHNIGDRYERILHSVFPELSPSTLQGISPDFEHPGFYLEGKTGFFDFGVQIKQYQVDFFPQLTDRPVIYAIGFHDFANALHRLAGRSDKSQRDILRRNMKILSTYFVSQEVIGGIWKGESRASAKEGRIYCTLKKRFLENIINGTSFKRAGKIHAPQKFYSLDLKDYLLESPESGIHKTPQFPFGLILHTRKDAPFIDYLNKKGFI